MQAVFADPEVQLLMADPSVSAAVLEVLQNPGAMSKHQGNPGATAAAAALTAAASLRVRPVNAYGGEVAAHKNTIEHLCFPRVRFLQA